MAGAIACDSEKKGTQQSEIEGWDFGDDPLAIRLNVEDGSDVFACGAGFTAADVEKDVLDAVMGAKSFCQGSEGNYVCECDGESKDSYAFTCPAALLQACEVEAQRVDGSDDETFALAECEAVNPELSGECVAGNVGFECSCGDGATSKQYDGLPPTLALCDQLLFNTCATTCEDDFGGCAPSPRGTIGEYDCTCDTNAFGHVAYAASCEAALLWACSPLNEVDDVCTGYGGACQETAPGKLSCTCVDRSRHDDVAVTESGFRACRAALEATCGTGAPPDGAQCIAEGNGHHARCTRGPSDGAKLTCECYADGASEARVEQVEDHDCDTALLEDFCPEIAD